MADWNDLKYLLQVARDGSTLAASRSLKTNQTTVMRRVASLEAELGLTLFEKRRSGYAPTETLEALMPNLEAVEQAQLAFAREAETLGRNLAGTVRLTAPDLIIPRFVTPVLYEMRSLHPGIHIELITTDAFLDLTAGDADIAIRAGDAPSEPSLFGRRVAADDHWSVFCSRRYAAENGAPQTVDDLADHNIVAIIDGFYPSPVADWLKAVAAPGRVPVRHSNLGSAFDSVKSGHGVSAAPDIVIYSDDDLVRCFPLDFRTGKELWLLAPERHRRSAHIRATMDFLASRLPDMFKAALEKRDRPD